MPVWRRTWFLAALLVLAVIMVYQPVWQAGFIWDDDVYILKNKLLTAPDGLTRIWFSQDSPSQYFPLVYTAFRLEHALWGVNPTGYHWINLLLHAANALLVWRLLWRLKVPGAFLGAALFALHPVQVETVAWITERKNLLCLFFSALSVLGWIEFIEDRSRPVWRYYALALGCYLLALFSKTTACTLPAALLLILWLRRKPIHGTRALQVLPFVLIGLVMGLLTMWWERYHIGTSGGVFNLGVRERILIASRALWFYAGKLIWPTNLTFSYPRWVINPANPLAYAWLAGGALLCAGVWVARRWVGRSIEVALLFFVATLSPMLGLIMLYTFRYTFVADHYQYIACIGPLALLGAGLARLAESWRKGGYAWHPAFSALVLGLGALSWRQAGAYKDVETLWRDTVAKNPDSWMAYGNLGRDLTRKGEFDQAMQQYAQVLRMNPHDVDSLVSLGNAMFAKGELDEAMSYYQQALAVNPRNPEAHVNLAVILANRGRIDEAIEHDRQAIAANSKHLTAHVNLAVTLAGRGRYQEALEEYRQALALNPDQPLTHINLAIALTALGHTDEAREHSQKAAALVNDYAARLVQQGRTDEAAAQYREAIRLIPDNPAAHCGLGILLARQGKTGEARNHFAAALRLKPGYAEAERGLKELDRTQ